MKILLLGCRGKLGWELQRALGPLGSVTALGSERAGPAASAEHSDSGNLSGDLEQPDALRRTVRRVAPEVIVNAAAYTDVDKAETEPERAERVNADAPGVLAAEAARLGALLVHFSTDYVFDGRGTTAWREADEPAPLNVYGASKRRGEEAVRDAGCEHLIFRTQWLYAARGESFLCKILRLAAERDSLEVVDDQHGAPTGVELVADVTAHAIRRATAETGLSGLYHLAARGETTWYDYARFVIAEARRRGLPIRVRDAAIRPAVSEAFPTAARRPRNGRLGCERLEHTFGLRLPEWRLGVVRAIEELAK